MAFFRLQPVPSNTWPALPNGALAQVWTAYQALDRTQWLDPATIERQQLAQVRELLTHCVAHIPYYRDQLARAGIVPADVQTLADFRRLPLLNRQLYQDNAAQLAATALPPGMRASGEHTTSGTSGVRLKVLQTTWVELWWCACYLRDLEWCNLDPTGTMAGLVVTQQTGATLEKLLHGVVLPCWFPKLQGLVQSAQTYGMDLQQDHRRQLAWLRQVDPDYLLSYPSNLEVLASLLEEEPQPFPRLRAIQSISEAMTPDSRARIEAAFGVPIKDTYSCTEAGYLASPCPLGHGLHVHEENVLFEVLDEAGQPCEPGETGRVVLTTLHNFRGPFLRYEIGDEVTLGPATCPCGRGLRLLASIEGKRRPMLYMPDGRRRASSAVIQLLKQCCQTRQYQIVQKAVDHVVIRLVPAATYAPAQGELFRRKLQEFFAAPIRVDLQLEERLHAPGRAKLQGIVVEVKEDGRQESKP